MGGVDFGRAIPSGGGPRGGYTQNRAGPSIPPSIHPTNQLVGPARGPALVQSLFDLAHPDSIIRKVFIVPIVTICHDFFKTIRKMQCAYFCFKFPFKTRNLEDASSFHHITHLWTYINMLSQLFTKFQPQVC